MEPSKIFKDAVGREWTVELSTAVLRRLAAAPLSFSLNDLIDRDVKSIEKYQTFIDDDLRFADVLFAILKPHVDKCGLNQEQFEEGLKGDGNARAILAFHAAYLDFSHGPRKTILRGLQAEMEKAERFGAIASRKIEAEANRMTDSKMEEMIDEAIQKEKAVRGVGVNSASPAIPSSSNATVSPAISASTPIH